MPNEEKNDQFDRWYTLNAEIYNLAGVERSPKEWARAAWSAAIGDKPWTFLSERNPDAGDCVLASWPTSEQSSEFGICVVKFSGSAWHNPDDDEDEYSAPEKWQPLPKA